MDDARDADDFDEVAQQQIDDLANGKFETFRSAHAGGRILIYRGFETEPCRAYDNIVEPGDPEPVLVRAVPT